MDTSLELWNRAAEADDNDDDNPKASLWPNPTGGPFDDVEDIDSLESFLSKILIAFVGVLIPLNDDFAGEKTIMNLESHYES